MPLTTNFNVDPYYDDFDEDKNFHRILYKPGSAVQARELTQSQTLLQDQIKKFGDHVFKSGSIVTGGQITIQNTVYLNIASTYSGADIVAANFEGKTIQNPTNTKRAYVLKAYDAVSSKSEPITFVINQIYGSDFEANESIRTVPTIDGETVATYTANLTSLNPVGNNQTFSVAEGVFYYEGFFVKNQPQSIAIDKYSQSSNALIGFEVGEEIIDYTEDTTLLDPAQSSSNFQAPGADRYKITLTLATRSLDSTDLTKFVELSSFKEGLVQKVIETPIYGKIGDEFARRTYDESGDYVVKDFDIALDDSTANSAFANVTFGPGKAYIRGYEYQTIAPTIFSIPKPRTVESVNNQRISSDFGYYVFANNLFGNFATNQFGNVNVSCISASSVNAYVMAANTSIFANTIIGEAKIKLMSFVNSSNTSDANTYIYKVFLTDVNTRSIGANNNYGSNLSAVTNASSFTLPSGYAANNNAYVGGKISFIAGPGSTDNFRTIRFYDGSSRLATVDRPFAILPTTDSRFKIDFDFGAAESFITLNTANLLVAAADIHSDSKKLTEQYQPAFISDIRLEPLLLKVGENNVADNTIADFSYTYRRLYQNQQFSGGVSSALSVGTGETLQSATTTAAKQQYYTIVVTDPGGGVGASFFARGQTVPVTTITSIDTDFRTITVTNGGNMRANIYATIVSNNPTSKTKTFIPGNTTALIAVSGGTNANNIFGNNSIWVASLAGQTHLSSNVIVRTPGQIQSLYVSDVSAIKKVLDFNGLPITSANFTSVNSSESANVTSRYEIVSGQKDSYYDWGGIRLKPGQVAPRGPLLVIYDRFISTGTGFFNVDSYTRLGAQERGGSGVDYGNIPIFTSQDGFDYKLADYLDFRPVRRDAINTFTANNYVFDVEEAGAGPKISEPGNDIITDYSYYLPRVDRVVLHKSRTFEIIQGIPGKFPITPAEPEEAMTLYILNYPPYLTFPSSTAIQRFRNKRYTMKDISVLEKRIENLEYYTSLSLAELATLNKQDLSIRDDTGLPRFKNGMLIDSFVDKSVADVTAPDFAAAIDIQSKLCRGSYNIAATRVFSNSSPSDTNVDYDGPLLMLSSTSIPFIEQPKASKTLNINPFNVVNYIGTVLMDPASDVWTSVNRVESQNIDLTGGQQARDAWSSISSTSWGAWQTSWVGSEKVLSESSSRAVTNVRNTRQPAREIDPRARGFVQRGDIVTTTTQRVQVTQTQVQSRTGILTRIVPQTLTKSLGDRLLDVTIVQYMRAISVLVLGQKFKPFTTLYSFFDNTNVDKYVARVNPFTFANNNLGYQTTISRAETVKFHEVSSNTVVGTGGMVLTSNNVGYVVTINPTASFGSWANATSGIRVVGNITRKSHVISSWKHYSGTVRAATSNTITLAFNAGGASETSDYVGQPVFIVRGKGVGQSATVSAYDSSNLVLTINGTWSTTPDTTSVYSIGRIESDGSGGTAGIFNIPADIFRTGEKQYRLIDNQTNTVENSKTNGDTSFYASGIIETKQETSVSVFTPTARRTTVSESVNGPTKTSVKTVSSRDIERDALVGYYDPLAQTFLVNGAQYPQGIIIDSIRVCFRTKDTTVPVTLQIRPVVNGFPSSSVIYPYGEKTLTPDEVKTTTIPDITDANKYTEFRFDVPVLLLPGEHCFVLLSNSIGYEAFIAEIGATDLKTNVKISEQPYTGSLFLSQNGSTWTPDQLADLMFSIQKRVFTTDTGYAYFEVDMSTNAANVVYDIAQLMSTDAVVANTSIIYDFSSEIVTGGQHSLINIVPNIDYEMNDGYGRRVLSTTTGNTTFKVRATLQSSNPDVSPMIDTTRLNLLTIENKINNMPLQNSDFIINNQGTGYATPPSVVISGGGGSGANAYATVDGGLITSILLDAPGTGYIASPTVTISGGGGSSANVTYNGEDRATGGNAGVRYITKRVQLASGFDAGDLRVYLTMYKPPQSGILVYYKLLAANDPDVFDIKNYQLMTQLGDTNFFSADESDVRELTFAPGAYNSSVANNKVSYSTSLGTYPNFTTFAIKIVLYGVSTVDVPKVSDLRVIALPSTVV